MFLLKIIKSKLNKNLTLTKAYWAIIKKNERLIGFKIFKLKKEFNDSQHFLTNINKINSSNIEGKLCWKPLAQYHWSKYSQRILKWKGKNNLLSIQLIITDIEINNTIRVSDINIIKPRSLLHYNHKMIDKACRVGHMMIKFNNCQLFFWIVENERNYIYRIL